MNLIQKRILKKKNAKVDEFNEIGNDYYKSKESCTQRF